MGVEPVLMVRLSWVVSVDELDWVRECIIEWTGFVVPVASEQPQSKGGTCTGENKYVNTTRRVSGVVT